MLKAWSAIYVLNNIIGVLLLCCFFEVDGVSNDIGGKKMESKIRLRMSAHDAHYGGDLVDGARMLQLFGDVATELLIRRDGDEGLFRAYDKIEFLAPVYAGDYIEAVGSIVEEGNTSRKMVFEARKVIIPRRDISESACEVLEEPIVVCRASGTCVTPKNKQRGTK